MTAGVPFKWTPERHHMALVLRDQGMTFEEIAAHLGTSKSVAHAYFLKNGLDTTSKKKLKSDLNSGELADIERRLEAREPSRLIAASYGLSKSRLNAVLASKYPSIKRKQRPRGAPRATAHEIEMANLERYSKLALPIHVIAYTIKRSPTFLREKIASDEDNPWKEAFMRGRVESHLTTGLLMEKTLNNAFDSDEEITGPVVQVLKHWDSKMNGFGEKVHATIEVENTASNETKMAEKALWVSDRQMALIEAGKLDHVALLAKDKMGIIAHARELEAIPEAEWWDIVGLPEE